MAGGSHRSTEPTLLPPRYSLEINLTKSKWTPSKIDDIPEVLNHAFETYVTLKEIQPLYGTDHVKKWPLDEEKDIPVFLAAKSQMNEAFAEKVIKFTVPRGLMPHKWVPKKVKILAKGPLVAKYFGEDTVGTRQVEVSLKLFDCGHFYMKQSLPGGGPTPYQICFEGRWQETQRGFQTKYQVRYTGQATKKSDMDHTVQAVPPNQEATLAQIGESEMKNQLNGLIPAIVGEDPWCRVEIYRCPDKVEKGPAIFNTDCPDPPSWKDPTPTFRKRPAEEKQVKFKEEESRESSPPAAPSRAAPEISRPSSASSSAQTPLTATSATKATDDVPMWPTLVGAACFVTLFLFFSWVNWADGAHKDEPDW